MHPRTVACLTVAALVIGRSTPAAEPATRLSLQAAEPAPWETVDATARPAVLAARVTGPVIDGVLDDAAWSAASPAGRFAACRNLPDAARDWAEVKVAFDDRAFYIGARLAHPGRPLVTTLRQNGGRIWSDDCLEIRLADPAVAHFCQVVVNAAGAWWAGANPSTIRWEPPVETGARDGEGEWTVEVAIPWTDLGGREAAGRPWALDLRYLSNGGSSETAWSSGGDAIRRFGTVYFDRGQVDAATLAFSRFRLPAALPAGTNGNAVQVEARNPSAAAQNAVARLLDRSNGQIVSQVITNLAPGAGATIGLALPVVPGQTRDVTLLAAAGGAALTPLGSRRVAALPPLRLSLERERLWAGEDFVQADLDVGLPLAGADSRLSVELWDDVHRVAQAECAPIPANRMSLRLDARGLPAGVYRLRVSAVAGRETASAIGEVALLAGTDLPERRTIPLRLQWPDGAAEAVEVPVYAGLAFPAGMLTDEANVRVVGAGGAEVPCQSEVLARWSPRGAVKWLGLRFPARAGVRYEAEVGRAVRRSALPAVPLRLSTNTTGLAVDTGPARFELPFAGPLIGRAWVGGTAVLDNTAGCLGITDQRGRTADETGGGQDEAPVVEVAGPLYTVIRREGLLRTAAGERLGKYVVRLEFHAGQTAVNVEHTFINTEPSTNLQCRDLAFRVRPAFDGPWQVHLDTSPLPDAQGFETAIAPAKGEGVCLFQSVYKHHFMPDSAYAVERRDGAGTWSRVDGGAVCGDWASVAGKAAGVAIAVPHFAQLFPKELEAGPEGLTAHLWSGRGGRLLDYRAAAIAEHTGTNWYETMYPGGLKAFAALHSDAAGSARTHDLVLDVFAAPADPARLAATARRGGEPVLAIQDPAWLRDTDALGPLQPYDPERFGRIEGFLSQYFDAAAAKADVVGDYGFLDFGNGPHTYDGGPAVGGRPRFYRYYETDYQFRSALWRCYARSGDRRYYDYARRYNRHLNDFQFSYWPAKSKPQGAMLSNYDADLPLYWKTVASFWGSQGIELNNYFLHFYLCGDRRVMDGVRAYADYMAARFDPLVLPNAVAGANHNPYECLADLYGATWDERLGRLLRQCRERMIDPSTGSGLVNQDYYGAWYKPHIRVHVHLKDWIVTGSDLARRGILKWFDVMLRSTPPDGPLYQNYDGLFVNYAERLTGDTRYADWFAEYMARVDRAWLDDAGRATRPLYTGTHGLTFLGTAPYGLELLARSRAPAASWPVVFAKGADLYVAKELNRPLTAGLRCGEGFDLQLATLANPADGVRRGHYTGPVEVDARPGYFSMDADQGLTPGYARLHLPPDVLPGEYRLKGVESVLWADACRLVLAAPRGVELPVLRRGVRWFFCVPAGKAGSLIASRPVALESQGKAVSVPARVWQPLEGGTEDRLWSLSPTQTIYVRFAGGIPPVLAQDDTNRFFLPAAAPAAEPPGALEEASAVYVPGLTGRAGDQGVLVNGGRALTLPRGKAGDRPWRFEFADYRKGTLEFWFKPQWISGLQAAEERRPVLQSAGWECHYVAGAFDLLGVASRQVYPYQHQRLINRVPMEQGEWHHFALCWEFRDGKIPVWGSEMYIDGRASGTDFGRPGVGLTRCGEKDKQFNDLDVVVPRGPFVLPGGLDAVVDEIRVSTVPRYRVPFAPLPRRPFETDEDTVLLFRLDGALVSAITNGVPAGEAALKLP